MSEYHSKSEMRRVEIMKEAKADEFTVNDKPSTKPREWFINPVAKYKCEVNEDGIGLTGNEIHVVEHSAYIAKCEELAGIRKDHMDDWKRIQDAERALEVETNRVTSFKEQLELVRKQRDDLFQIVDQLKENLARQQTALTRVMAEIEVSTDRAFVEHINGKVKRILETGK